MINETCANLSLGQPDSMITDRIQARVILAAVFSLVAAVTVLGNLIVIAALVSVRFECLAPRGKNSSIKTHILLISMAVSDAVLGCVIMPFGIYNVVKNRQWELGGDLCNVREVLDIILSAVSFFHVTCMALDRYLAVCRPLLFRTLTNKASFVMIGVCWIVPSAIVMTIVLSGWHLKGIEHIVICSYFQKACIFKHNKQSLLFVILALLDFPLIVTFVLYFLVLREVRKYHKRKPATYFSQEKLELQVELNNRKVIGTKRLTVSHLPKESRENDVEMTSQEEKSVSVTWGLLHCFVSRFSTRKIVSRNPSYSQNLQDPRVLFKPCDTERMDMGPLDEGFCSTPKQPECENTQMALPEDSTEVTKVLRFTNQSTAGNDSIDSDNCAHRKQLPTRMAVGRSRSNIKAVTTIGLIVACFTACWLPMNIAVLVSIYQDYTNPSLSLFVLWLAYTNSMINPIIYCYQRSIRRTVLSLVCRMR